MKMRKHRKRQMLSMRNSTASVTLGVGRWPKLGFSRRNIHGSYAELKATRARGGLTVHDEKNREFGPNFKRPKQIPRSQ
jgi:hypothetical protein